jgi:hypothetical protein
MARDNTEETGIVNYGGTMSVNGCAVGNGARIVISNNRVVECASDDDDE